MKHWKPMKTTKARYDAVFTRAITFVEEIERAAEALKPIKERTKTYEEMEREIERVVQTIKGLRNTFKTTLYYKKRRENGKKRR